MQCNTCNFAGNIEKVPLKTLQTFNPTPTELKSWIQEHWGDSRIKLSSFTIETAEKTSKGVIVLHSHTRKINAVKLLRIVGGEDALYTIEAEFLKKFHGNFTVCIDTSLLIDIKKANDSQETSRENSSYPFKAPLLSGDVVETQPGDPCPISTCSVTTFPRNFFSFTSSGSPPHLIRY